VWIRFGCGLDWRIYGIFYFIVGCFFVYSAVLHSSFLALDFKQLMTQIWVAGCWVQFPNGAAYVLVSYGLSCAALLRFFQLVLLIFNTLRTGDAELRF
jgi:hypothetical protein